MTQPKAKSEWTEKRVFAGYFQTQANNWIIEGNWIDGLKPTHWMPLPDPPAS